MRVLQWAQTGLRHELMTIRIHGVLSFVLLAPLLVMAGCEQSQSPQLEQLRERLHVPGPDFVGSVARGQELFRANCTECHGQSGQGTEKGPPLIQPIYRPGHHADLSFHLAVKNGVRQHHWNFGHMKPVDGVTPEDVGHIIAYVRKEQRAAGIE